MAALLSYSIETYDSVEGRLWMVNESNNTITIADTFTEASTIQNTDDASRTLLTTASSTLPVFLPAGMYDQELSESAAEQMQQVLEHRIGQPTRSASDLPEGDLSMLRRRREPR